jgi:hypothetical protein
VNRMKGCSLLTWHIDRSCCHSWRSAFDCSCSPSWRSECWLGWHIGTLQRSLHFLLWLNMRLGLWTCCPNFFFCGTTETLETLASAPWALAFGGAWVVFFFVSFFFAVFGVVVSFNLKLVGNFIIPSSTTSNLVM